jgi:hypothetical protein
MGKFSSPLDRFIEKASEDIFFIGYILRLYINDNNLSENELSEALKCNVLELKKLYMCRLPDDDPDTFQCEIGKISKYVGCDAMSLAKIIREQLAVNVFRSTGSSTDNSILMAARDRLKKKSFPYDKNEDE